VAKPSSLDTAAAAWFHGVNGLRQLVGQERLVRLKAPFDEDEFTQQATHAVKTVNRLYVQRDFDALQPMLTPRLHEEWVAAASGTSNAYEVGTYIVEHTTEIDAEGSAVALGAESLDVSTLCERERERERNLAGSHGR
jgi:predicted lipid-binding transport protein (Tim44 family)